SDRQAVSVELVRVDLDHHGALAAADERDRADSGHGLDALLESLPGDLRHLAEVAVAGDGDAEDRRGVEVEAHDDRRLDLGRKRAQRGPDLVPDVLRGLLAVALEDE